MCFGVLGRNYWFRFVFYILWVTKMCLIWCIDALSMTQSKGCYENFCPVSASSHLHCINSSFKKGCQERCIFQDCCVRFFSFFKTAVCGSRPFQSQLKVNPKKRSKVNKLHPESAHTSRTRLLNMIPSWMLQCCCTFLFLFINNPWRSKPGIYKFNLSSSCNIRRDMETMPTWWKGWNFNQNAKWSTQAAPSSRATIQEPWQSGCRRRRTKSQ